MNDQCVYPPPGLRGSHFHDALCRQCSGPISLAIRQPRYIILPPTGGEAAAGGQNPGTVAFRLKRSRSYRARPAMSQLLSESEASTSRSLLARVRRRENAAWERFADLYSPLVYGWARRAGVQPADAADVVQDVFRTVFTKIDDFQKDGQASRFRGWLWAITRNRIRLYYRQAARTGQQTSAALEQAAAVLDSDSDPSGEQGRQLLLRRALQLIEGDFTPECWQAFWQFAMLSRPAAEVAAELNLSVQAVRQAKYRVLCRLREELLGS